MYFGNSSFHFEEESAEADASTVEESGAVKRLAILTVLLTLISLTSCHHSSSTSTAITCSTSSSSSSTTTSTSTCTDPTTGISVTISPATLSVNVTTSANFIGVVSGGTNSKINWEVNGTIGGSPSTGTIDTNGRYTAPSSPPPSPSTVTVGAFSYEESKLSATATVTITPAPVVTITSPAAPPTVAAGTANTVDFSGKETGGSTNIIDWDVNGVSPGNDQIGMISGSGVYSAPRTPPVGSQVQVTAVAEDFPTSSPPMTVTISGYSTSSLQSVHGPFVFSVKGSTTSSGPFFRAGMFRADGNGNLVGGVEDINEGSVSTTGLSFTGTYSVASDGRGTLTFNDAHAPANLPAVFDFVLVDGGHLQITGFDSTTATATYSGTASGQAVEQNTSLISGDPMGVYFGTYVFDFAGVHGANAISQIGEFTADGNGNITSGSIDINDGGTATQFQIAGNQPLCGQAQPPPSPSTYTVTSGGRGTVTLNLLDSSCNPGPPLTLVFYAISPGIAKFVGSDSANSMALAGFTLEQAVGTAFNAASLNGNFAFLLSGSHTTTAVASAGSFTSNAAGVLSAGTLDENAGGTTNLGVALTSGTYTVSSTGRGTATFTIASRESGLSATYIFVFYLGPSGIAVFQETDSGIVSDGLFTLQASNPSINGNYAIATSSTSSASSQVISGELAANGTGSSGTVSSGTLDINTGGTLSAGQAVTGGSYATPAANGRTTIVLTLSSGNRNFAVYVVDSTQAYIVGTDASEVAAGSLLLRY